ncbi:MBL fold metallo-hydrolase [Microbacterium aurum]
MATRPRLSLHPGTATDVSDRIVHLRAPNADEWTYGGTNTWLLAGMTGRCMVVDPGVADHDHLGAVQLVAQQRGWIITAIALTHDHEDHSDGARELAASAACPIIARSNVFADVLLEDGLDLTVFGVDARSLLTPGHSDDSVCFDVSGTHLLTGDTLLGGHSSGVYGDYGDYLRSLERLVALTAGHTVTGLPGHGSVIDDTSTAALQVLAIRRQRAQDVRDAIAEHPSMTAGELAAQLYPSAIRFHLPSATQMVVGIACHLLKVDHDASSALRAAYRRLSAERVEGM